MNRIKKLREEFGYTQQDLANKLNGSKSVIGLYENEMRKPSLEILVKLSEIFDCSIDYILCKTDIKNAVINVAKIPILGTVKAGYDWLAEENVVDYITLKENIPNIKEYYALKITGDSMLPLLSKGDLVIVHDQDDVESGQTAVILINGEEATVKKVVKTNEGIELHSMNPYYPVKKFTYEDMKSIPVKIIGRVKEAKIKGAFE
ncbi:MAG: LexA family transcriptional regulator [Clostridia bacterium]|jgi:repressor LexA